MNRIRREFRPTRPRPKDFVPSAFLALLLVIIAPGILARPTGWSMIGLAGVLLLVAGGVWLQLRDRWPGQPVMRVDNAGMTYTRWGKSRHLAWRDIVAMPVDFTLDRMSFVPREGKPIRMRPGMVAEDGTHWLMVIEDYWRAPRRKGV